MQHIHIMALAVWAIQTETQNTISTSVTAEGTILCAVAAECHGDAAAPDVAHSSLQLR